MKKTANVKWDNLKVGIILSFAVFLMFWASLSGGGISIFESKEEFTSYFRNVNGLVPGAPVRMAGVEVGNVRSVRFVNIDSLEKVEIICKIKEDVWQMMTENTVVQMGTIGFLGDKYIEIIPGAIGAPVLPKECIVPVRDADNIKAAFKSGKEAIGEARSVVNNIDSLLGRINGGQGTLGQLAVNDELYSSMTILLSRLTKLTADLQKNQERIVSSIEKTSNSVENLTEQVNTSKGTIGKLIKDPKLYDNLTIVSQRLDSIVYKINTAEGSLGLMVSDTGLYVEMTNLMTRVGNLVTDIENNPDKYFKFSVF
ncbi:MAG: MlaD family protein [candidate division Zixibacteria bacterium]|nr:MlaD family protein [candidate division Zixibacteria bacterium]